jgi:hypothetical protein
MPHPNHRRRVLRIALFSLAVWAFTALSRGRPHDDAAPVSDAELAHETRPDMPGWASSPAPARAVRPMRTRRRLAANLAFVALFFTGASFSAVAGDNVANLLTDDAPETPNVVEATPVPAGHAVVEDETEAPEAAPAPAPEPAPEAAPAPEVAPAPEAAAAPAEAAPAPEAAPEDASGSEPETLPAEEDLAASAPEDVVAAPAGDAAAAPAPARPRAKGRQVKAARPMPKPQPQHVDPEVHAENVAATVWLHRELPDPTPPSLRLAPTTASRLHAAAKGNGLDWAYLLAVVRADGAQTAAPTRGTTFAETARRLAALRRSSTRWDAALALTGRTAAADRAVALARYYRAVGLQTLVDGLLARQDALEEKVLADERVQLYAGGRADVEAGRINVRVLALIEYLAESYGQVTVSSLSSGHRVYARPGVVSAHTYGQAVDIAGLANQSIVGHQEPGGLTERAVRDVLLLPAEMRPRQVISLLGLGGPSFPLANHDDHIHVGF